ncbi:hypothetical protein ACJJTC_005854 [Scirpophaga incertulas]
MLLQRRSLRSRLDLLRSVSARELCVSRAQHSQQQHAGGVLRDLAPSEPVWARSFRQPDKWLKGTVANNQGSNRYVVNSGDGRLIPRHIDQIRRRSRMSNVPCPSGTNSDQFEGQVSIGSEDALADSNIPDVGSNDDVAEAISVTKSNSEISGPKPVEDPSEPTLNRVGRYGFSKENSAPKRIILTVCICNNDRCDSEQSGCRYGVSKENSAPKRIILTVCICNNDRCDSEQMNRVGRYGFSKENSAPKRIILTVCICNNDRCDSEQSGCRYGFSKENSAPKRIILTVCICNNDRCDSEQSG